MTKSFRSEAYNYDLDEKTGLFLRWGAEYDDDPPLAPLPEILDIEISTACHGVGQPCRFCYKSNGPLGQEMAVEDFRKLLDVLPTDFLTQIAFGIGDLTPSSNFWQIAKLTREKRVVPNVTINGAGLTQAMAHDLVGVCGAVAVSRYGDGKVCYDAVEMLTNEGGKQINVHQLISAETMRDCRKLVEDAKTDPRLARLNAIVFLMLKPKGRAVGHLHAPPWKEYAAFVNWALDLDRVVGFDSCSAPSFLKAAEERFPPGTLQKLADPCESGLFSLYIDVNGDAYPCSFCPGTPGWEEGIHVLDFNNFLDVWHHPRLEEWKAKLLNSACKGCSQAKWCRSCPVYPVSLCKGE